MSFAIRITNPALEVRAVGPYAAHDVRAMMADSRTCDFRQLGCPDAIFQRVLERRAGKRTVALSNPRTAPAPALSADKEWFLLAAQVLGQGEAIAQDRVRATKELSARTDGWEQKRFDEIKSLLKTIQSGCVDDAIRADKRLRELLTQ